MILIASLPSGSAWAHDPIFGIGPHVLFKGGVEISPEVHLAKAGDNSARETALNLTYGITGDWAAGIELPYTDKDVGSTSSSGRGDIKLFTKYRFWRNDTLGAQESAAVLLKVKLDTAGDGASPALGSGTTATILGLTFMDTRAESGTAGRAYATASMVRTMAACNAAKRSCSIWSEAFGSSRPAIWRPILCGSWNSTASTVIVPT